MKCLNFTCFYGTNKGLYMSVNTVVGWAWHSSSICPLVTDAAFALGK